MTMRIAIEFVPAEGVVLRVLGLVERRGFLISAVTMPSHRNGEGGFIVVDVQARDGNRRIEVLEAQLRRLHDIRKITASNQGLEEAA